MLSIINHSRWIIVTVGNIRRNVTSPSRQHPRVALYLRPIAPPSSCSQLALLVGGGANRRWGGGHVTLCSFAPEPGVNGGHPFDPFVAAIKAVNAAGSVQPERDSWVPSERMLRWYEDPNGWVFVTLGDSRTLQIITKVLLFSIASNVTPAQVFSYSLCGAPSQSRSEVIVARVSVSWM